MRTTSSEMGCYVGEGLESTIFENTSEHGTCILKKWKDPCNMNSILYQVHMQQICHHANISPGLKWIDFDKNCILMEKLNCNLLTFLTKMKSKHTPHMMKQIQNEIITKWKELDDLQIFHNDSNICNIMLDDEFHVKIIDFGFSIQCDSDSNVTNMKQNPAAYVKWIKEWNLNNPHNRIAPMSYSVIEKTASSQYKPMHKNQRKINV